MSNPYQSPQQPGSSNFAGSGPRDYLHQVAKYQRLVILALGLNILFNIVAVGARTSDSVPLALVVLVVALGTVVFSMATMFMLANRLYGIGLAIVCTVLMLVPCLSLITLLVVNQKATNTLQASGIKVGLLGADPNTI
jgi:hypothetical protein